MNITLSLDQQRVCENILAWYKDGTSQQLTLGGYAGTGKTTILAYIAQELADEQLAFVSLTGKAVNIMKRKMKSSNRISTIHSFLYRPIIDEKTKELLGWEPKQMAKPNTNATDYQIPYTDLIINDEGSMTGEDLHGHLAAHERKMLFVGDHGQLPPIGTDFNLMKDPDLRLEKMHRVAEDNPILVVATRARENGYLGKRKYSDKVQVINENNVPDDIAEMLIAGDPETLIITGINNQRVAINMRILQQRGRNEKTLNTPEIGDRLVCLRNENKTGLYNGAPCTLLDIISQRQNSFIALIQADDFNYPITVEIADWAFNQPKPRWPGAHARGLPFDYGYCFTCHKAQGSEAKRVFVLGHGFGDRDMKSRWLYTAVTRAQEELYVLQ